MIEDIDNVKQEIETLCTELIIAFKYLFGQAYIPLPFITLTPDYEIMLKGEIGFSSTPQQTVTLQISYSEYTIPLATCYGVMHIPKKGYVAIGSTANVADKIDKDGRKRYLIGGKENVVIFALQYWFTKSVLYYLHNAETKCNISKSGFYYMCTILEEAENMPALLSPKSL